jgi:hypothetical protein
MHRDDRAEFDRGVQAGKEPVNAFKYTDKGGTMAGQLKPSNCRYCLGLEGGPQFSLGHSERNVKTPSHRRLLKGRLVSARPLECPRSPAFWRTSAS